MKAKKTTVSLKLILIIAVVILGTIPLILMRTVLNKTVQVNILKNTTILTQSVLTQSQRYLNLLLRNLDLQMNEIMSDTEFLSDLEKEGLSDNVLTQLQQYKENTTVLSSMVLINTDSSEESVLLSSGLKTHKLLKEQSKKAFLDSQQAILLIENNARTLWLGSPPYGIFDAIPSIWTYRFFTVGSSSYILGSSLDRERLISMLAEIGTSARSDILLLTSDNIAYPYDNNFFNYPFAAEALSRSTEGRFNIMYSTRETPSGVEKLMIQVYSDSEYDYNLIIITPQKSLLRGYASIEQTTTITLLILAICSLSLGAFFTYFLNKRIRFYINTVNDIAEGRFNIKSKSGHLRIEEDLTFTLAISEMAEELKRHRHALELTNETLEKKVSERTEELQKSLNELHMTKQSLIHAEKMAGMGRQGAKLAHEMNNPLSVAITASSHLSTNVREINRKFKEGKLTKTDFTTLSTVAQEVTNIVQRNLKQATELTSRFKDFASDMSREDKKLLKLDHYIGEIIKSYSYKLKNTPYRIELICGESLEIITDPSIIYQTITNLINNSLLHGFEGKSEGKISIEILRSKKKITIIYSDDGNGMSSEVLSQLYKPFYTTKREEGGTGLGLNIIRGLIEEELEGTIECTSTPGSGVTFSISFPLTKEIK